MAQKKSAVTSKNTGRASKNAKPISTEPVAPKRREIAGIVFLLLAIFCFIGFFTDKGKFIVLFCNFLKGLIGGGFYLIPFSFVIVSFILLFHHGKPVTVRLIFALLIPFIFGGFFQLVAVRDSFPVGRGLLSVLWKDGIELLSGGVLAGVVCAVFVDLFTKIGAGVLYVLLIIITIFVLVNKSFTEIIQGFRKRERTPYEPESSDIAEPKSSPRQPSVPAEKPKKLEQTPLHSSRRPDIDIPLDDELSPEEKTEEKKSFFNRKSRVESPADYLSRGAEKERIIQTEEKNTSFVRKSAETEQKQSLQTESDKEDSVPEIVVSEPVKAAPIPESGTAPIQKKKKEAIEEVQIPDSALTTEMAYVFPPMELLTAGTGEVRTDGKEEARLNKERLENALSSFGIHSVISNIIRGPSVTRYEMELEAGVRLNRLTNLADDIALALGVSGVRIAAIPNKISTVGIEIPNKLISTVYLRDIIASANFRNSSSKLTFAIGQNISGEAIVGNIAKLPHLLVAGTTGSGKSVCLNSMILSIMYKATPDEVKFIMVDPKMVEFKIYNGIPHLLIPVVTEAKKAAGALQWAVTEMLKRYRLFSESGARDIQSYNDMAEKNEELSKLPRIVVVIDELADLMLVAAKEVEESICRVAQMGRAAGVHLVIATQSPRADVITGLMKANIPSRIALKVSSSLESRIILDSGGSADKLVGNGDMLFAPIGTSKPTRIQGTWVSDEERESIVEFIKQSATAEYDESVIAHINEAAAQKEKGSVPAQKEEEEEDCDELLPQAIEVILETGQASVSMLQRRLKLGYARAARIVDQMEEKGVVGPFEGSKPRQILITKDQWMEMQFINGTIPVQDGDELYETDSDDEPFDESEEEP